MLSYFMLRLFLLTEEYMLVSSAQSHLVDWVFKALFRTSVALLPPGVQVEPIANIRHSETAIKPRRVQICSSAH